jgi:pimeloyl-ACP methyl ester carboxylesterase
MSWDEIERGSRIVTEADDDVFPQIKPLFRRRRTLPGRSAVPHRSYLDLATLWPRASAGAKSGDLLTSVMQDIDMSDRRVRYSRNGSVRLAYREFGEGDTTLVWNPGWFSNVDLVDEPASPITAVVEQLAEVTRTIVWDKRGTGLSDPATHVPPLDERMDDLHAVLDAAKVDRPALFGMSEGGPMSLLFAATYPERVHSLVMYGVVARFSQELPGCPWGFTAEEKADHLEAIESHWGEGALAELFFGEIADVPGFRDLYGRYQRASASPTMAAWLWQALLAIDVRGILGSIRAPTLVLARPGDRMAPLEGATALAAAIPGSQFKTLPEGPHALVDEAAGSAILDFVCGTSSAAVDERVVKTVLFTDIVSSTEMLSARGDAHWRRQLNAHDKVVDWFLEKYGGRRVKHTGDGVFALFDGPTKAARCALEPRGAEKSDVSVRATHIATSGPSSAYAACPIRPPSSPDQHCWPMFVIKASMKR